MSVDDMCFAKRPFATQNLFNTKSAANWEKRDFTNRNIPIFLWIALKEARYNILKNIICSLFVAFPQD